MTLITVVETTAFSNAAKGCMKKDEVDALTNVLANDPEAGDIIQQTGGIRKLRFAIGNQGKSGSVRVVYYFYNDTMPVFLMAVFAKNEKDNLSKAERNTLAKVARALRDNYGE